MGTMHIRENLQEISLGHAREHLGKCAHVGHTLSVYHIDVTLKSRSTMWKATVSISPIFSVSFGLLFLFLCLLTNKFAIEDSECIAYVQIQTHTNI